jgi:hypothetical protein
MFGNFCLLLLLESPGDVLIGDARFVVEAVRFPPEPADARGGPSRSVAVSSLEGPQSAK